ncbi:MAG TPA: hypothetical protein VF235_02715 [Actinomycetota bacterium]
MPEPTTVWMVPLVHGVHPVDVEGTLALADDALEFRPAQGEDLARIPLEDVTAVKRHRVSPILSISWRTGEQRRRAAFYFAPPPPLHPIVGAPPTTVREANRATPSRRKQRRKNTLYLSTLGGELRPLVLEWAREVRAAVGRVEG